MTVADEHTFPAITPIPTATVAAEPDGELHGKVSGALRWSFANTVFTRLAQLGLSIVLAHLLAPERVRGLRRCVGGHQHHAQHRRTRRERRARPLRGRPCGDRADGDHDRTRHEHGPDRRDGDRRAVLLRRDGRAAGHRRGPAARSCTPHQWVHRRARGDVADASSARTTRCWRTPRVSSRALSLSWCSLSPGSDRGPSAGHESWPMGRRQSS